MKKAILTIFVTTALAACSNSGIREYNIPGPKGEDGLATLVELSKIKTSSSLCESETGVMLVVGLDEDRDGILSPEEKDSGQIICDGANGKDGEDGEDGEDLEQLEFDIVSIVNLCDNEGELFNEILIELRNGMLLASFSASSSGNNTRLTVLELNRTYTTTDGFSCSFYVDIDGEVSWSE